ncbi:MAG: ABC transporter ATP-binding protein, partial [Deltaproteobacteria bacterium]|nr:ABC transporter ATP-binding protein [Deltaproteobacteria bacterium]
MTSESGGRGSTSDRAQGSEIVLERLSKAYTDVVAVDDVSFRVERGKFLTLLGPSGSGKTTTLMMVAGFEAPDAGSIYIDGMDVTAIPPHQRGLGMVFQNYALFPHMNVFENVAFPLRMRKAKKSIISERVRYALEIVKLEGVESRRPNQLSGGQQQRVAIARCLAFNPRILLLDEPLGALDKKLREHMQIEIKHLQEKLGITVIYVTHDQEEALVMSDSIVVMNNGKVEQIGSPDEIYDSPANAFVAEFIGKTNFMSGVLHRDSAAATVLVKDLCKPIVLSNVSEDLPDRSEVRLFIRPERISIVREEHPHVNVLPGTIDGRIFVGDTITYAIRISSEIILSMKVSNTHETPKYAKGDKVNVSFRAE